MITIPERERVTTSVYIVLSPFEEERLFGSRGERRTKIRTMTLYVGNFYDTLQALTC